MIKYLFTFFYIDAELANRVARTSVVAANLKEAEKLAKELRPNHDYKTYDVQQVQNKKVEFGQVEVID